MQGPSESAATITLTEDKVSAGSQYHLLATNQLSTYPYQWRETAHGISPSEGIAQLERSTHEHAYPTHISIRTRGPTRAQPRPPSALVPVDTEPWHTRRRSIGRCKLARQGDRPKEELPLRCRLNAAIVDDRPRKHTVRESHLGARMA